LRGDDLPFARSYLAPLAHMHLLLRQRWLEKPFRAATCVLKNFWADDRSLYPQNNDVEARKPGGGVRVVRGSKMP
jgi:hypothetical protein